MMSVLILAMINLHKYLADIPEERPTMGAPSTYADFLFVFHCRLYRFRVIISYFPKFNLKTSLDSEHTHEGPNFTHSKDMTGPKNFKMGHVTFAFDIHLGWFVIRVLVLDIAYLCTKF